jgi:DNA-binding CsgD family transcriptional regulator
MVGDGAHPFELEVARREDGLRVSASPVVVLGPSASYAIVYLLEPLRRRRRADEMIDRFLAATEPGSSGGLPAWWSERRSPEGELTPRQFEVLRRLAQGETPQSIASAIGTSIHTVRTHVQALYERLGVHSRAQAVAFALRHQTAGACAVEEARVLMATPAKRRSAPGAVLQAESPPGTSSLTPPVLLASRVKS